MDIEWAKDGDDGKLYIVQARPETVKSRQSSTTQERFLLQESGDVLVEGRSIGQRIGKGPVRLVDNLDQMDTVQEGDVLVTDMTDPDWEPVMKRASAIVTNRGGRTCHAAIIARELGIPAVVGCVDATEKLKSGDQVTVSCAEGDTGYIYAGDLNYDIKKNDISNMPELPFKVMMNVANPDRAFTFQSLPHAGVGLARLEFIINRMIGIHPKALINFDTLDADLKEVIQKRIGGYSSPIDFYVQKLVEGISSIAAAFYPERVIVRMADFKSNEYAHLIGGTEYEPSEENPMIGFRGASRYVADNFRDCFELECQALKIVRENMGFDNVEVMIPFVRTPVEAKQVIDLLAENDLRRGENGLKLIMMCELPANALLADQFLEYFDGFSIGSNDLTQLTLGLDRDSGLIAHLFDERNDAVKSLLSRAIEACKDQGKYVGAILMDLSKAFDVIPHGLLVAKLKAYGYDNSLSNLILSYLSHRNQRVRVNEARSNWSQILKGVPQGSILGPTLFNVFMNDIFYTMNDYPLYNYADDNTVSYSSDSAVELLSVLAKCGDDMTDWFSQNGMRANPDKYQVIIFGKKEDAPRNIVIKGNTITCQPSVKLLGITIDDSLSFNKQIHEICKKAGRQINAIMRLCNVLDTEVKETIYRSFIQSNFNYCPAVWLICSESNISKLAKVQFRALKFVYNDFSSDYEFLLQKGNHVSISVHLMQTIAIEVYKCVNGIAPEYLRDLFCKHDHCHNTRNNDKIIHKRFNTVRYGYYSFKYLGAKIWNNLPVDIKDALSIHEFKKSVKQWKNCNCLSRGLR
jgi:phosphohistidine swiveling domain-containing protein